MKIRTGHTFTAKEAKIPHSDGNETSSSESAEASIYGTVAARRSTILSCPFSQYSRIPRLAKPVSIPVVPGMKAKKNECGEKEDSVITDLDIECVLSASLSTSSTSLGPASNLPSQMSCSAIYQGDKHRLGTGSCGSIFLTPDMARKMVLNTEDQKDCGYESIYATPTRYMPRRRQRIRKPTTPPPPPPIKREEPSQTININSKESGHQESSQHINQSWENAMQRSNIETFDLSAKFDFLYDW